MLAFRALNVSDDAEGQVVSVNSDQYVREITNISGTKTQNSVNLGVCFQQDVVTKHTLRRSMRKLFPG